ncbi:MAG: KTSC domain-containing protein [Armatimonadota bacterium]|nr:KTSC domain-containing protein [Armatimonadota bacterium]
MRRTPVESSSLSSVGYDPERSLLELEFHGGRIYQYFAVPRRTFEELMTAASVGAFVNRCIKPRFPFRRVEGRDSTQ